MPRVDLGVTATTCIRLSFILDTLLLSDHIFGKAMWLGSVGSGLNIIQASNSMPLCGA